MGDRPLPYRNEPLTRNRDGELEPQISQITQIDYGNRGHGFSRMGRMELPQTQA
jgi:hypothetical protein